MPSRRAILAALGLGVAQFAGCGGRQSNTTTHSNTSTQSRTATHSPTPSDTPTATPEETPRNVQCDRRWDQRNVWTFGELQEFSAIAAGPTAVYTATENALFALEASTGQQRWRTPNEPIADSFHPSRLIVAGDWVLAVGRRHLVALDRTTGRQEWSFTAPGKEMTTSIMEQAITVVGETVYAGVVNTDRPSFEPENPYSRIYAFDIATGTHRIVREFSPDSQFPRYLTGDKRGLYCAVGGRLIALADDGTTQWNSRGVDDEYSMSALSEGVVLASDGETMTAFDATTGQQLWHDAALRGNVAVSDGVGYATAKTIPEGNGQVTAFDPETGTHYWEATTRGRGSPLALSSDAVFLSVTSSDGRFLTAFDSERGCRLGSFDFSSDSSPPVVGAGRVSAISRSGGTDTLLSFKLP
ncbi:PQQ-binding-like beta-propeller repeat protein [Haloferax sp. S1W]|uniref:outer membrane protein assembly factor BamB family protein n=1 Tax=Haloferax sp. S1W TaxID=3377110 RepID=UPI0037C75100